MVQETSRLSYSVVYEWSSVRMALQRRDDHLDRVAILLVAAVLIIWQPHAAIADPQGSAAARDPNAMQQNSADSGSDYNGEDFTRPESKFETRFQDMTSGTTTRTDKEMLLLRLDSAIKLDAGWKFGWLAQIPVVDKNTTAPNSANSSREFGIGDAAFQGVLSQPINERWSYGFGARLVVPSAEDALGSGKW